MKAFYSDTFVLPLPEHHRFPMAKYRLLRERLVAEQLLTAGDLEIPEPISWDDLRLVHDAGYADAVDAGTLSADAQRRIGFPWSPMMVERSRRSVGATLAAARSVVVQGFSPGKAGLPPSRLRRYGEPRRSSLEMRASGGDRKSTRLNSSHVEISYAVFCLKKKKKHCPSLKIKKKKNKKKKNK